MVEELEECIDWCLKEYGFIGYEECLVMCVTGFDEDEEVIE